MPELQRAAAGAAVIDALQHGDGSDAERLFRQEFNLEIIELRRLPPQGAGFVPPFMATRTNSGLFVFCCGAQNRADAQTLGRGYAPGHRPPIRRGANVATATWATHVITRTRELFTGDPVYLFGHSAGGCTVEHLAAWLEDISYRGPIVSINTYGSPSAGHASAYTLYFRDGGRQRWMANGDPVPYIPQFIPERGAARTGLLLITAAGQDITRYIQPAGGLRLTARSVTAATFPGGIERLNQEVNQFINEGPQQMRAHSAANYASLLYGRRDAERLPVEVVEQLPPPRAHEVPEPVANVGAFINILGGVAPPTPEGPRVVVELDLARLIPPNGVGIAVVNAAGLSIVNGPNVPATFVSRNMAQARLGKSMRFFTVKVGNNWCVGWLDLIIATYQYPSAARTVARAGNRFLRVIGNRGGVNMPDFENVWGTFVSIASVDPTQYRPVLVVNT